MPPRDMALACIVALIWGVNFVAAQMGMEVFPPLLLAAMRFTLVALPAVFFVRPPGNGWKTVVAAGLTMGVGQFGLLYSALHFGMPAGLASLVLQVQTVFTVVLAAVLLRERPARYQVIGIAVGVAGMAVVGWKHMLAAPALPFLMTVAAAASWAVGNVVVRRRPPRDGFSLVVWSALISPIPLFLASLLIEGWPAIAASMTQVTWRALLGLAFITYLASMAGYGIWNLLLSRHSASAVAPWSMLVPPIGMVAAFVYSGEQPGVLGILGGVIVTVGVLMALGVGTGWAARHDVPSGRPAAEPPGL
ncbi:EamA family transporter [Gephyromycinifex aptenodytis]|uniref:EamA family transporter n=1 Tax=Gephyromycinifex aptenodytis TaxID=2716227 RepID=UPI0014453A78|nr:EamA family transporter [Gephyromycinifex aptenodytis]